MTDRSEQGPAVVVFRALAETQRHLALYLNGDTPGEQWRRRRELADTEPPRHMRRIGPASANQS